MKKKKSKILVIMESPTKTKTVQSYLGDNYKVVSSEGHISNLSASGDFFLGVDLKTFVPKYRIETKKKPLVKELVSYSKKSDQVILATDPDREGEAIAYHLMKFLNIEKKYSRIRFNEITKDAILLAFDNPTTIDFDLFKSQETRRILDRFIGFRLSKLLYSKIKSKSAGRVQSVVLKILVERSKERQKFVSDEYWTIEGKYQNHIVKLDKYNNKIINIKNLKELMEINSKIAKNEYLIKDIIEKLRNKKPPTPFTTSLLLQQASNKINFSPSKTSFIAQQLYEGINIGSERKGLITYPRTDSKRYSKVFTDLVFKYIEDKYGKEYIGNYVFKVAKNSQNAHEAIRPTDIKITPLIAKKYLKNDQLKLYTIIYNNALASLMSSAVFLGKKIILKNNNYEFSIKWSTIKFEGFLKILCAKHDDLKVLSDLKINSKIKLDSLNAIQHFTQPPSYYNVASIIKKMEELGIGRPSTYSTTIYNLQNRGYIVITNKAIDTTKKGILTNDMLQEYFQDIIHETYTSEIELKLDKIAKGEIDNIPLLEKFWSQFEKKVETAFEKMPIVPVEKTGTKCPKCGEDLVYRYGKFGEFIGCGAFPKCHYIYQNEEKNYGKCTKCKNGSIVLKNNKRNQKFLACSNYPKCDFTDFYKEDKKTPVKDENIENEKNQLNTIDLFKI